MISKEVGTGLIAQGNIQDIFADNNMQWLVLNIKLETSSYFKTFEDVEDNEITLDFFENIPKVADEFVTSR